MHYYNEIDSDAASWLRELIAQGHIAPGDVDERDIRDITPNDLTGYTQVHFFAGIGVWSHALRLAGWPDDRPVWTGSCPCQPFSAAGKGDGFDDERHLWPHWHYLIEACRPVEIFGEQVASKDGLAWLDLVSSDLEGAGYACGAVDLCAAGMGAPHIRQRLYFHAATDGVADAERNDWRSDITRREAEGRTANGGRSEPVRVADANNEGSQGRVGVPERTDQFATGSAGVADGPGPTNGFWRDADWLGCRDGKWRPARSGTLPLAHGSAARVGRLRGYGNAIVPQVAQAFIEATQGW